MFASLSCLRSEKSPKLAALASLVLLVLAAGSLAAQNAAPVASVDPFIGTGTGPGDSINLFPGPGAPFGMVQLSPDTESNGFGYHFYQNTIQGFSMTHMSGVGCPDEGDVFFTATTGPVQTGTADFESPYSHSNEEASPGYYRVLLTRWNVSAELAATDRTGAVRFTFPAGQPANVLVPISHTLNYTTGAHVLVVGNREIQGYVEDRAFCGNHQTYRVYFVMTFNRPFASFGTWNGTTKAPGDPSSATRDATQSAHDGWIGAYASWPAQSHSQTVEAKIGISYVDLAGAKNNLRAETAGKSFSQIRHATEAAWNRALGVIDVSGGTPVERTVFYTALYHSLLTPSTISDADGRYLGFDGKIHHAAAGHLIYANYSGWDIYRSQMPLVALVAPRRMEDMAQSVALMYQQGGWVGRWPQINLYTNVMAGSPLSVVLATAWLDGLHGFDMKAAWNGMYADATQAPPDGKPYAGEGAIDWINKVHYAPDDKMQYGSVSQIQEDAIAYASLYRLAVALGKNDEARTLYERALDYRNVFDPADKFFRPRNADGQWVQHFNPSQEEHGFIEGSGWHYQWLEPADLAWVIQAMGPDLFNQRLTHFFDYKKPGWYGDYYNPYNETDLEAPFEFNFSGEPWKTQHVVRRVLAENYTASPDGVPGNDDCGEMSSWAVMSMMGFYSVDPASLAYELVSPVFPHIVVHLHAPYSGGTFTVETSADPDSTPYITRVALDGHTHTQNWIDFHDITRGGTLRFSLDAEADKSWGAAPQDAPPSLSQSKP
ncbi:MAG TPA: GH92 family glycosyl hydrolase [Acidobacteriaceae bacterium]|jgi:predicted alpha-1,2-mannosidase|nr:GH92 family glycosyl hydrolase [Acidobacteriaceae bacterium]